MSRFRLAHFSDVHYTVGPFADPRHSFHGKRLASFFSYYLGGRGRRFRDVERRIATLLDDVDAMGVDHAICTGDLTASSLDSEFAGLAGLFGERLQRPDRYTVLPGNHDRYVESAVRTRAFERHFESLGGGVGAGFPFAKTLAPGLRLVAIDASRPTGFTDATGLSGPLQNRALRALLDADTTSTTLVAMHYGLVRWNGNLDHPTHRMLDAVDVLDALDATDANVALVLHGHMHGAFTAVSARRTILCAGSATDLLVDCGYFVYELDLGTRAITIERRHWNRREGRFETIDCTELQSAVRERRGEKLARQAPLT